jgi:mannose/fructose/N-acetylgalactosamine-specific phosphotransferase system component IIC
MIIRKIITSSLFLCMFVVTSFAQEVKDSLLDKIKDKAKEKLNISGTMGITYEGYGLDRNPSGWTGAL